MRGVPLVLQFLIFYLTAGLHQILHNVLLMAFVVLRMAVSRINIVINTKNIHYCSQMQHKITVASATVQNNSESARKCHYVLQSCKARPIPHCSVSAGEGFAAPILILI